MIRIDFLAGTAISAAFAILVYTSQLHIIGKFIFVPIFGAISLIYLLGFIILLVDKFTSSTEEVDTMR